MLILLAEVFAETTKADILDHAIIALITILPVLVPVLLSLRKHRKITEDAQEETKRQLDKATDAVQPAADLAHAVRRIENKLDDHKANSDEFWEDQRNEMMRLAVALGEHLQDRHTHTIKLDRTIKSTSEPLQPGKRSQQSRSGRAHPKATGD